MASGQQGFYNSVVMEVSRQRHPNLSSFMARIALDNVHNNVADVAIAVKQENSISWNDETLVKKEEDFENSKQVEIKSLFACEQKVKEEIHQQNEESFSKKESVADQVTGEETTGSVILPLSVEGCDIDPSEVKSERASPEQEPHVCADLTEALLSGRKGFSQNYNVKNETSGSVNLEISGHTSDCQIGSHANSEAVNCCDPPVSQHELLETDVDEIVKVEIHYSKENSQNKQQHQVGYRASTDSETLHQSGENETSFSNFIVSTQVADINGSRHKILDTLRNELAAINGSDKSSEILNTVSNEHTTGYRRGQHYKRDASNVGITSLSCEHLLSKCDRPGKLYRCDDCGQRLNYFSHLKKHLESHLKRHESFKCSEIQNTEPTSERTKICRRKWSYMCDTCNANFSSLSRLRTHLDTHLPGKLYRCDDCGKQDTSFSYLKRHISSHLKKQVRTSLSKDSLFSAASTVQRKRLKQCNETCCKCDLCSLNFSSRSGLVRHKRKHTQDTTYISNTGCVDYSSENVISKHQTAHTIDETYVCDLCSAIFTHRSNLQRHTKLHTKPKSFVCDLCGLGFSCNYNLTEHRRSHTGEKPYACHICNASYSCKSNLSRHRRIHTQEKRFLCDVCGAAFGWPWHLTEHKRTHTGEKPYKCDVCNVKFAAPGHLKKHRVIHTGERNYKCETCGKSFSRQTNLRSHQRIHNRK